MSLHNEDFFDPPKPPTTHPLLDAAQQAAEQRKQLEDIQEGVPQHLDGCECIDPHCADHAVLMVGYNDDADIPYWKIKNRLTFREKGSKIYC